VAIYATIQQSAMLTLRLVSKCIVDSILMPIPLSYVVIGPTWYQDT